MLRRFQVYRLRVPLPSLLRGPVQTLIFPHVRVFLGIFQGAFPPVRGPRHVRWVAQNQVQKLRQVRASAKIERKSEETILS